MPSCGLSSSPYVSGLALHMAKKRTFSCRTNTGNPKQAWVANQNAGFASSFSHIINWFRPFSHDVKAAMLEFQTDPVGVGLFLCKQFFFAPINLHRCWPCEWKRSIMTDYVTGRDEVNLQSILIGSWKGEIGLPPTWDCQLCCTRKHQFVDSLLVNDMMAEYFSFNGLWHKTHRQQNLTNIQNFWNLDQNKKKSETKQGGITGKLPKELH